MVDKDYCYVVELGDEFCRIHVEYRDGAPRAGAVRVRLEAHGGEWDEAAQPSTPR